MAIDVNLNILKESLRDGLQSLTGENRLDSSAIKNLTNGLTIAQIVTGIETLENVAKLDYLALKNLPTLYTSTNFDIDLSTKTLDDISESVINKYFTQTEKTKLNNLIQGVITVNNINADGSGNVTLTKSNLGLADVDNISDVNKPISTLTQTALDNKINSNSDIIAGTFPKISFDNKGLVTVGEVLLSTDIPDLATSKITSGTFLDARIPNLGATKITNGTFNDARIPFFNTSKITSGTFIDARIPNLATSKITSGTFDNARISASSVLQHVISQNTTASNGIIKDVNGNFRLGGTFNTLSRVSTSAYSNFTFGNFDSQIASYTDNTESVYGYIGTNEFGAQLGSINGANSRYLSITNLESAFYEFSEFFSDKIGLQLFGFGETNNFTGAGANYSSLAGTSFVPRKFLEDITGLKTALNTTNKTSLVAAINEILASSGGGLTIAQTVTGIEAITTEADKLNYLSLKNRPTIYTSTNFDTDLSTKNLDNISESSTNKYFTQTEKTKLSGIEAGAQVNVTPSLQQVMEVGTIANIPANSVFSISAINTTSGYNASIGVESLLNGGAGIALALINRTNADDSVGFYLDGDGSTTGVAGSVALIDNRTNKTGILLEGYTTAQINSLPGNALITKSYVDAQTSGGGGLTIAQTVTGIEAITTEADKLNYLSLKNRPTITSYTSTNFDADLATKNLDDISESVTNKYFTQNEKTKLNGIEIGAQVNAPILTEIKNITASTYTVIASDNKKILIFVNSCTVTLNNSLPIGTELAIQNETAVNTITITAQGTLQGETTVTGQYNHAAFYKQTATIWTSIVADTTSSPNTSVSSYLELSKTTTQVVTTTVSDITGFNVATEIKGINPIDITYDATTGVFTLPANNTYKISVKGSYLAAGSDNRSTIDLIIADTANNSLSEAYVYIRAVADKSSIGFSKSVVVGATPFDFKLRHLFSKGNMTGSTLINAVVDIEVR